MVYSIALPNRNAGKVGATAESGEINAGHAVRNEDRGQTGTTVESIIDDGGHATVYGDHTVFAS